jgi:hypothetical protein
MYKYINSQLIPIISQIKELGYQLEYAQLLDVNNPVHIGAFHRIFLPLLNNIQF